MSKKIYLLIISIVVIINILLLGTYVGFGEGYQEGAKLNSGWFVSGGNVYDNLAQIHLKIILCLLVFVVGKSLKKEFLSIIICFLSLSLTFFPYQQLYLQKSIYFTDTESFSQLLRNTIALDWFCFFIVLSLLIYQIVSGFQDYFNWRRGSQRFKY